MRALISPLLLGGASLGCGLAAVGVALHGAAWAPALLYGGFGVLAGLACTLLHWAHHRLPVHEAVPADGPGEAPAAVLARTMLAQLAQAQARGTGATASPPPVAAGVAAVPATPATPAAPVEPAARAATGTPPARVPAPGAARPEPSTFGA